MFTLKSTVIQWNFRLDTVFPCTCVTIRNSMHEVLLLPSMKKQRELIQGSIKKPLRRSCHRVHNWLVSKTDAVQVLQLYFKIFSCCVHSLFSKATLSSGTVVFGKYLNNNYFYCFTTFVTFFTSVSFPCTVTNSPRSFFTDTNSSFKMSRTKKLQVVSRL